MTELTAKERLQPSLLDRLTDEDVDAAVEPRSRRVLSMDGLRRAVLRDLACLLNSTGLGAVRQLNDYPAVTKSVLNYGFPDFTGMTASGFDAQDVEQRIKQAIWDFEPRILRDSLQVRIIDQPDAGNSNNQAIFEIHGELWGQPLPERLYLQTQLDLEMGEVTISDLSQS